MTRSKNIIVWLIWLTFFPTILFYLYNTLEPSFTNYWFDLIAFAVVICAVAVFPIQVGSITIFFINGVSFAIFLYFGLFAEIILTQLALVALFIKIRLKKNEFHRIATNSTMLLLTSIFSAGVYYTLGGTHGILSLSTVDEIVPLVGYIVASICINQFLLTLIDVYIKGNKLLSVPKSLFVDGLITMLIFPIGLILYILYLEIGVAGIFIVGFPAILLSVVISTYHKGTRVNTYLHETSEIGHELSKKLNVKSVLDTFINEVVKLIPLSYIYVYDITRSSQVMNVIRFANSDDPSRDKLDLSLEYGEGFAGRIYETKKGQMLLTRNQINEITDHELPDDVYSVLGVPILRNNQVVGVLVVASKQSRAYEKYHLMLLEILGNFLSVAIENARHYQNEKNKSQRDRLTGLYNYRFFMEHLEEYALDLEEKGLEERLSVILFDLDSFKQLNDTYGHEAGNEVLVELAKRIEEYMGNLGIVARYGGEEFTVLLKGINHDEALGIAEEILRVISARPFVLKPLTNENENVKVYVTASIGVATYPDHCDSPEELIRQADRAMYVGAKRSGKNRVASIAT
ncbi:sensor domain-containing diguanylate cyclase [Alkalibacillus aidingensis]|uniref:sensor domain-containing diguanylate cyclase n=1 Tax=Alkalibacillus aidingensis TaxID=2747607 RepID=UPI00166140FE|nr:sensor domain-containing diguanylate cyclase [Alkalibacillus aidingensis]